MRNSNSRYQVKYSKLGGGYARVGQKTYRRWYILDTETNEEHNPIFNSKAEVLKVKTNLELTGKSY